MEDAWGGAFCFGGLAVKVPSPGPAARGQTAPLTLTHSLFGSCWHLHATLTAPSQRLVQTGPGGSGRTACEGWASTPLRAVCIPPGAESQRLWKQVVRKACIWSWGPTWPVRPQQA